MPADFNSEEKVTAQHLAAFAVAIGWLRGALGDVIDGDGNYTKEDLKRIHDATATVEIAKVLGKKESDIMKPGWDRHLSEKQKHQIGGYPE